jgi:hypothetical protein
VIEEVERAIVDAVPPLGGEPHPVPPPPPTLDQLPPPVVEILDGLPAIGDDPPVTIETPSEEPGGLVPPEPRSQEP